MTLHVVFCVAGTEYALPVSDVLQMESFSGATAVPGSAPYVAGIVSVRGLVIPVIDLRVRFGLAPIEANLDTRIVVTQSNGRIVALRVDSAREVLKLDDEKSQPAPSVVAERTTGFVHAVHPVGQRLLLLVDLPKLLGESSHDHEPLGLLGGPKLDPALPS